MIACQRLGDSLALHYDKRYAISQRPFLVRPCLEEIETGQKQFLRWRHYPYKWGSRHEPAQLTSQRTIRKVAERICNFGHDPRRRDYAAAKLAAQTAHLFVVIVLCVEKCDEIKVSAKTGLMGGASSECHGDSDRVALPCRKGVRWLCPPEVPAFPPTWARPRRSRRARRALLSPPPAAPGAAGRRLRSQLSRCSSYAVGD